MANNTPNIAGASRPSANSVKLLRQPADFDRSRKDCHELLVSLKGTVEGLLSLPSNNVWNMYGGLDRLRRCVEDILAHRQKSEQLTASNTKSEPHRPLQSHSADQVDYWSFVNGLRWLTPITAPYLDQLCRTTDSVSDICRRWIIDTLAAHNLSTQLTTLVNCRHHLLRHYHAEAYLCQPDYFLALLICLRAVEQNQPALLADVNPIKLMQGTFCASNKRLVHRVGHRRSASLPVVSAMPAGFSQILTGGQEGLGPLSAANGADISPTTEDAMITESVPALHGLYQTDKSDISSSSRNVISGAERMSDPLMNFYATSSNELHRHPQPMATASSSIINLNHSTAVSSQDIINATDTLSSLERLSFGSRESCQESSTQESMYTASISDSCIEGDEHQNKFNECTSSSALYDNGESIKLKIKTSSAAGDIRSEKALLLKNNTIENHETDEEENEEFVSLLRPAERLSQISAARRVLNAAESLDSILNADEDCGNSGNTDSGFNSSISGRSNSLLKLDNTRYKTPAMSLQPAPASNSISSNATSVASNSVNPELTGKAILSGNTVPSNSKISDKVAGSETGLPTAIKISHHVRSMSDFNVHDRSRINLQNSVATVNQENLNSLLSNSLPLDESWNSQRLASLRGGGGHFRQPQEGQSLMSFLSSQDFHTCTDLDRENAHFSIAEALIAAIEYMKWNQMLNPPHAAFSNADEEYESDEEIQQLKQRIQIRRTERFTEKAKNFPGFLDHVDMNDSSASLHSDKAPPSFESLSQDSKLSSSSSEQVLDVGAGDEDSRQGVSNLAALSRNGLSLSMASLFSETELRRSNAIAAASASAAAGSVNSATAAAAKKREKPVDSSSIESSISLDSQVMPEGLITSVGSITSADSIALALLRRFSSKQLPKASELVWLVSEQDAPQKLLPLPESYPVSPDDGENSDLCMSSKQNRLRGNLDWAPPRAQIISTIHPKLRQKEVLSKQNNRCAGCGSKVELGLLKRYQYCEYLGKYFCACCHTRDRAYIPGRILCKWDFTKYAVSRFACDLIRRIYSDPLFSVEFLVGNYVPGVGWTKRNEGGSVKRVKALEALCDCRVQLYYLSQFIRTCTQRDRPQVMLDECPGHWFNDLSSVHIYSIDELVQVKKNELLPRMKELVATCIQHVQKCILCRAKGFICEICSCASDIIFPFELEKVSRCLDCWTCFHKICFNDMKECPKCARLEYRKKLLASTDTVIEENEELR